MSDAKKPWQSKTILGNAVIGIAPFFPGVSEWIAANPETFGILVSVLNLGLRSITGESVSWKIIDKKF